MTSALQPDPPRSALPDVVLAAIVIFTAAFRAHDPMAAHRVQVIAVLVPARAAPGLAPPIAAARVRHRLVAIALRPVADRHAAHRRRRAPDRVLHGRATQSARWLAVAAAAIGGRGRAGRPAVSGGDEPRNYALGVLFLSGLVIAAGVSGMNIRVRRAYLHEVEQRAARLEFERDQQGQLAVAAERTRIAREMHDVVAHNLTVMVALADGAALTTANDPDAGRGGDARVVRRRPAGAARDAPGARRAPRRRRRGRAGAGAGLVDLDRLVGTIRRTGIDATLTWDGALPDDLPPSLELSIYRLVQESLTNTVKHAARRRPGFGVDPADGTMVDRGVRRRDNGHVIATPSDESGHGIDRNARTGRGARRHRLGRPGRRGMARARDVPAGRERPVLVPSR